MFGFGGCCADAGATAAVAADGYDEESLRVLLRAYVAGGQVAAALAAYAHQDLPFEVPCPGLNDVELVIAGSSSIFVVRGEPRSDFVVGSENNSPDAFDIGPRPRPDDFSFRW